MHIFSDKSSLHGRTSYEWRNTEYHELNARHKTHGNNDVRSHEMPLSAQNSAYINCFGDVPKLQTKLGDIFANETVNLPPQGRISTSNNNYQKQKAHHQTSQPQLNNSKTSIESDQTCSSSFRSPNMPEDLTTQAPNKATTGRERLLEWLRTSQAKRDENNRQVFTRWIDRIENSGTQDSSATGINSMNPSIGSVGVNNPINFTSATTLLPAVQSTGLPGLLTAPIFIGNPMTALSNSSMHAPNLLRSQHGIPDPISTNYLPAILSNKTSIMGNCPLACGILPQILPGVNSLCGIDSTENAHCELKSVTPDHANQEILSQTNTNAQHCMSSLSNCQPDHSTPTVGTEDCTNRCSPLTGTSITHHTSPDTPHYVSMPAQQTCESPESNLLTGQQLIPVAFQSHPYYVTMPTNSEPICSQLFCHPYFYYHQNQMHSPLSEFAVSSGLHNDVSNATKFQDAVPLPVYYIPATGSSQTPFPGANHPFYIPDGGSVYMHTTPATPDSAFNCDTTIQPAIATDQSAKSNSFTTQFDETFQDEDHPNEMYSCAGANEQVYENLGSDSNDHTNSSQEYSDLHQSNNAGSISLGALNFDLHRWYSVLNDMHIIPNSDTQLDRNAHSGVIQSEDYKISGLNEISNTGHTSEKTVK